MCPPLISASQKSLKIRTDEHFVLSARTDVKNTSRKNFNIFKTNIFHNDFFLRSTIITTYCKSPGPLLKIQQEYLAYLIFLYTKILLFLKFYINEIIKKIQGRFCQFHLYPIEIEVQGAKYGNEKQNQFIIYGRFLVWFPKSMLDIFWHVGSLKNSSNFLYVKNIF